MEATGRVLILDTKLQIEAFRKFLGEPKGMKLFYAENVDETLRLVEQHGIGVVLVGCKVNGLVAEDLPDIILNRIKKRVQVILNSFNRDTCQIKEQSFVRSNIFDIIWPTNRVDKVTKRIHIALEAQKIEAFSFTEGEET